MCFVCACPACGYALAGRGSFLPDYIRTIGIPTFLNRTTVFNLETMLTEKVRAEFIGRGKYQTLPESTGVDALLTGEVANVAIVPSSFNTQQLATRYSIIMTARIELKDMRTNKVLWENAGVTFREEYDAHGWHVRARPGRLLPAGHHGPGAHEHGVRANHRQLHPGGFLAACR